MSGVWYSHVVGDVQDWRSDSEMSSVMTLINFMVYGSLNSGLSYVEVYRFDFDCC